MSNPLTNEQTSKIEVSNHVSPRKAFSPSQLVEDLVHSRWLPLRLRDEPCGDSAQGEVVRPAGPLAILEEEARGSAVMCLLFSFGCWEGIPVFQFMLYFHGVARASLRGGQEFQYVRF